MPGALVLCYHAVSERWPAPLSVSPQALESQLELLLRQGYEGVTFAEAMRGCGSGRKLAVTFDDAYRSVLERARPVLERFGLPGTIFVPTDFPAHPERPMAWSGTDQWLDGPYEDELLPLSWSQIGELAKAGWEVGSHTCSHARLPMLGEAALETELRESRLACERRLGGHCQTLAYPYGAWSGPVAAAAERAGYRAAGTLLARKHRQRDAGIERQRPFGWPRVGIYRGDDMTRFRLKVSRLLLTIRTWGWQGRGGTAPSRLR